MGRTTEQKQLKSPRNLQPMTRIILSKKSASASEPTGDAMWGMIIMIILLLIVAFFFCILPVYRLIKRRMNYWDQVENDPRWNIDHFQFSPTSSSNNYGVNRANSFRS